MPLRRESLTHSERAQRGRIGAYVMHAHHDARSTTAAARQAFGRRFLDLVDPERSLPEPERLRQPRPREARTSSNSRTGPLSRVAALDAVPMVRVDL